MTVTKYRKKPVVIEAIRYDGENPDTVIDWVTAGGQRASYWPAASELRVRGGEIARMADTEHLRIRTLEGTMRAEIGDYIIKGVRGEFYPCKPDIFAASYEAAEAEPKGMDAAVNAFAVAWGAKLNEVGYDSAPAGTKTRAGLLAALPHLVAKSSPSYTP